MRILKKNNIIERTEMGMIQWMNGLSLKERLLTLETRMGLNINTNEEELINYYLVVDINLYQPRFSPHVGCYTSKSLPMRSLCKHLDGRLH